MNIKTLYLSDLDGTLLQNDASLSPYAVRELNRMIEKGLCFYSSARSTGTVLAFWMDFASKFRLPCLMG